MTARDRTGGEAVLDTEKLFAARLHAVQAGPYLATALFAVNPVVSRRVPTMAVDRHWRCYVSPAFVDRMTVEDLAGVWVHEVSHVLRDHHGRSDRYAAAHGEDGPGERLRMNIAADFEINDDVYGDGLAAPRGAAQPASLRLDRGLLMEEYLALFTLGPATHRWAWLDCGSGADGIDRDWELGPDGAHGLNAQEQDLVRFRVAQGVIGSPGEAPGGWRRWAEQVVHPPQPWRALLGAAVRAAAGAAGSGDEYTFGRPSRRAGALPGVVLPSLRRVLPRAGVVIDTSGSVSDEELGSALLEVTATGRALGGRRDQLTVIACDAVPHSVRPLCHAEGIALVGGGGTDLRGSFAAAGRGGPDVIVALTDGQTAWPSRPDCRVVIGLFDRRRAPGRGWDPDYAAERPPAWARVVTIGDR